jgi:hypothetical protein
MRYFIIPFDSQFLEEIKAIIFGDLSTQRRSVDKKYFVASLCEGDSKDYEFLNPFLEFTEKSIKEEMKGENWTPNFAF